MFQSLNDRYYTLFAALYTNRALLPDKQYKMMSEALSAAYKQELDDLLSAEMLKNARQIYEMRFKKRYYIPRGILFWRNDVSRAYQKACKAAFRQFLADLQKAKSEPVGSPPDEVPKTDLPVPIDTAIEPK